MTFPRIPYPQSVVSLSMAQLRLGQQHEIACTRGHQGLARLTLLKFMEARERVDVLSGGREEVAS